jgi:hypothetical protein
LEVRGVEVVLLLPSCKGVLPESEERADDGVSDGGAAAAGGGVERLLAGGGSRKGVGLGSPEDGVVRGV